MNKRITFYSQNTNLLPPKPKTFLRHLKLGIQEFHLVPPLNFYKLLTSCLTAIKKHVIKYCDIVYISFRKIREKSVLVEKNSNEVLNKLKSR